MMNGRQRYPSSIHHSAFCIHHFFVYSAFRVSRYGLVLPLSTGLPAPLRAPAADHPVLAAGTGQAHRRAGAVPLSRIAVIGPATVVGPLAAHAALLLAIIHPAAPHRGGGPAAYATPG